MTATTASVWALVEAQAGRELLRVTLSSIGDAVIATDPEGRVTSMNPVAEDLTGWPAGETFGRPFKEVFRFEDAASGHPVENPLERALVAGESSSLAAGAVLVARDGRRVPVDDRGAPIRGDDGALLGAVLVFRDVTGLRRAEAALQELNQDLERRVRERTVELEMQGAELAAQTVELKAQAVRLKAQAAELKAQAVELEMQAIELEAQAATLAKQQVEQGTFLYTLSHDLRQPLLAIHGMTSLLAEAVTAGNTDEATFALKRVTANVTMMSSLLDSFVTLSRDGLLEAESEDIDLGAAVGDALHALEQRLKERDVRVDRSGTWPMIRFPKEAISRVLTNLLENAITYSGRPGERNDIWLGVTQAGEKVTLTVADNGPGIPAEYRERVFGLFKKLNPRGEGAGVGLTIVKRIVERHGGRVWVEDSEHGGAAVSLTLPAAAQVPADQV